MDFESTLNSTLQSCLNINDLQLNTSVRHNDNSLIMIIHTFFVQFHYLPVIKSESRAISSDCPLTCHNLYALTSLNVSLQIQHEVIISPLLC